MKKYLAEFIGTYALVFCGTGAVVINSVSGGVVGHQGIALTFGLIVMAMIYSVGHISGAHFNPAVTISFAAAGELPKREVLPYSLTQIIAAIAASGTLKLLFPDSPTMGETLPAGSFMQSFVLEFLLTFFLMFVIIQVATGSKEVGIMAGLAIGATVWLEAAFAGPICGASMNPARSIGPALIQGNLDALWIYLIAPVLGALLAVVCWKVLRK